MATDYAIAAKIGGGGGGGGQAMNPMQMMLMAQQLQSNRLLMEDRLSQQQQTNALSALLRGGGIDANDPKTWPSIIATAPKLGPGVVSGLATARTSHRQGVQAEAQTDKTRAETLMEKIKYSQELAKRAAQGDVSAAEAFIKVSGELGIKVDPAKLNPKYFARVGGLPVTEGVDREGNRWIITPSLNTKTLVTPDGLGRQEPIDPSKPIAGIADPNTTIDPGVGSVPVPPGRLAQMQRNSVAAGAGGLGAPLQQPAAPIPSTMIPPGQGFGTPDPTASVFGGGARAVSPMAAQQQPLAQQINDPARLNALAGQLGVQRPNVNAMTTPAPAPAPAGEGFGKFGPRVKTAAEEREAERLKAMDKRNIEIQTAAQFEEAKIKGKKQGELAETERKTDKEIELAVKEIEAATAKGGLLDKSTASAIGNLFDRTVATIGVSTPGAQAAAALAPIADLALKMVPRFEGPQGVRDVEIYLKAAGDLSDPTLPTETRRAAAKVVVDLMRKRTAVFETRKSSVAAPPGAPAAGAPAAGAPAIPQGWSVEVVK